MAYVMSPITSRQASGLVTAPAAVNTQAVAARPAAYGMPLTGNFQPGSSQQSTPYVDPRMKQQYLTSNQPVQPVAPTQINKPVVNSYQLQQQQQQAQAKGQYNNLVNQLVQQGMSPAQAHAHATSMGMSPMGTSIPMPTPGIGPTAGQYHPTSFFNPNSIPGRAVNMSPF